MKLNDVIKALDICLARNGDSRDHCQVCPLFGLTDSSNCKKMLANLAAEKLITQRDLLDDQVNHHYYDMLDEYMEENARLSACLQMIEDVLTGKKTDDTK